MHTHDIDAHETELPERLLLAPGNDTTSTRPPRLKIDESAHPTTAADPDPVRSSNPVPPAAPTPRADKPHTTRRAASATPKQQHNQRYAEILQEIRVAQTGVQLLLGFLMTLAFTPRFTELTTPQRDTYVAALLLAFAAAALLMAPAPFHRLVTRRGLKRRLVEVSSKLALGGLTLLMLSMNLALMLILDVVLGFRSAELLGGIALSGFLSLWFGMPLWHRLTNSTH